MCHFASSSFHACPSSQACLQSNLVAHTQTYAYIRLHTFTHIQDETHLALNKFTFRSLWTSSQVQGVSGPQAPMILSGDLTTRGLP